jgi:Acetyltransferase (GNAT) domain
MHVETTMELRGAMYRFVVLRGLELAPVIPLFRDAFGGREFSLDWLQRKYSCEHGGLSGFACVAFDESGDAAGSVGVLPWPVRFEDRVETAGQMVDVATGSAHRGRGLFVALAERARELCNEAGVGFLYGFPNEEAYPIWIHKLGYEHIHDLDEYRLPVRTLWAEKLSHRASPLRRLYERYLRRTLAARVASDPVLENSLRLEGFAHVDRDRQFHAYKAELDGGLVLDVEGGRVWLKVRHGLLIGDLEASSEAGLNRSTRALERMAARLGVHAIVFQASKDTRFSPFFVRRCGASRELPVIYRDIRSEIPKDKLRFTLGDLDNF